MYKEKSIEHAGGDEQLGRQQYEAAAKLFILATINATKELRPGCKVRQQCLLHAHLGYMHVVAEPACPFCAPCRQCSMSLFGVTRVLLCTTLLSCRAVSHGTQTYLSRSVDVRYQRAWFRRASRIRNVLTAAAIFAV